MRSPRASRSLLPWRRTKKRRRRMPRRAPLGRSASWCTCATSGAAPNLLNRRKRGADSKSSSFVVYAHTHPYNLSGPSPTLSRQHKPNKQRRHVAAQVPALARGGRHGARAAGHAGVAAGGRVVAGHVGRGRGQGRNRGRGSGGGGGGAQAGGQVGGTAACMQCALSRRCAHDACGVKGAAGSTGGVILPAQASQPQGPPPRTCPTHPLDPPAEAPGCGCTACWFASAASWPGWRWVAGYLDFDF